jgi:hypothetical protein
LSAARGRLIAQQEAWSGLGRELDALGIVESFSVASLIEGADAMVKTANVRRPRPELLGGLI